MAELQVGESKTFALSKEEVVEILAMHVCRREGIECVVLPGIEVVIDNAKREISHVTVTVRRTR